eukprot:CAMPEP_0118896052 /NCGR_PEP_ID=MMETSP1166-20130328/4111_1 /TAXON_ID=1104430 /ORGANISM="Chrysoreinhardia sp, Strain CCMP3193" /LENGTH=55 /DNA_ID=CAMNT_0006835103 /DNA_START=266 /DNA_END=433 /DNA_ORIENTATION=+
MKRKAMPVFRFQFGGLTYQPPAGDHTFGVGGWAPPPAFATAVTRNMETEKIALLE